MLIKILNDEELGNPTLVKEYLEDSFKRRKAQKSYKLYINICKIYDHYPEVIKGLLDNIPSLGYYKDYFYIFMFSRSNSLNNYIMKIVVDRIRKDMELIKKNKLDDISTCGKFLPRENGSIDKRIKFVDKFIRIYYPDINPLTAKRRYRRMKTQINDKLGTLEQKMSTKQYSKIDYSKVSPYALYKNKHNILKHPEAKESLDEYLLDSLKTSNLHNFIKELLSEKNSLEVIEEIWQTNNYLEEIPQIKKIIGSMRCIIDLSKNTFNHDMQYFTIGLALLVDKYSQFENKIMICGDNNFIKLNGSIIDKAKMLLQSAGAYNELTLDLIKYPELLDNKSNVLVITSKKILPVVSNKIIHLKINNSHKYDLVYYYNHNKRTWENNNINLREYKIARIKINKVTDIMNEIIYYDKMVKDLKKITLFGIMIVVIIMILLCLN